jgi:hypothetical protein
MRGPNASSTSRARRALALGGLALVVLAQAPGGALAAPPTPGLGPVIEDYAEYVGPTRCRPKPKPGVLAMRDLLLTAYPDTSWIGMSRACSGRPTSEHQEGRALDWARNASVPAERAQVKDLLAWLLAPDLHGNSHAMARRLGIMYIVWNRRMWSAWEQSWEVYCVQRGRRCKDPETKAVLHPHTDHVHFSFGWPGARMLTSYWHPEVSHGLAIEPTPTPTPSPTPSPSPTP